MQDTQDTQTVNIAVRVDEPLHKLIRRAAHKKELSMAEYVRTVLKEASEHYVGQA